jgi:hypothetical protein
MHGIPLFLSQITETLHRDAASDAPASRRISGAGDPGQPPTATEIGLSAACGGLPSGPFAQRGEPRTGLGIGLSISQRSIEANDGKLYVRNRPGKGCVFTVDLPLQ